MNKDFFDEIRKIAYEHLSKARGSHDTDHTERVYNLCMHIGEKEGADLEILKVAALLHDIGRETEDNSGGKVCHAELGAKLATEILKKYNYPEEKITRVVDCIRTHRFRDKNVPESLEAKVLFDADKLDGIGAVGIGRAFLFAGEIGAKLHDPNANTSPAAEYSQDDTAYREFTVKLKHVKDRIMTDEGKRIATERHDFMVKFFERLNEETEGEL